MTYIPRLFCICGAEMKPEKIGGVTEVFVRTDEGQPDEHPSSYYKVASDLLKCVACGNRVLLNAAHPLAMHHQSNYSNFTPTHSAWLR